MTTTVVNVFHPSRLPIWGYVTGMVCKLPVKERDELLHRIPDAAGRVNEPRVLRTATGYTVSITPY